jgi:predicted PurR-regulated permease PerM
MDNTRTIQTAFSFGLLALLFAVLVRMLAPFFSVFLWVIVIYILVGPLHRKAAARLDERAKFYTAKRRLLAGAFSLGTIIALIVPVACISVLLARQFLSFLKSAETTVSANRDFFTATEAGRFIADAVDSLSFHLVNPADSRFRAQIIGFVQHSNVRLVELGTTLASGAGRFCLSLVFLVFSVFFLFSDGQYLASLFAKAIPLNPRYMSALSAKFAEITRSLFAGYIVVALYQAAAAFVIMKAFGVSGALLFSAAVLFCAFIPLLGTALIWGPVGISILCTGNVPRGVLFLALCAVFVSSLDNFIRPFFLKDRINVHPLVIFFAILGGLKLFGLNGLMLGPLAVILFFTVLDLLTSSETESRRTDLSGSRPNAEGVPLAESDRVS